nr:hypothetical protein [Tanacetum cinerariifolium]
CLNKQNAIEGLKPEAHKRVRSKELNQGGENMRKTSDSAALLFSSNSQEEQVVSDNGKGIAPTHELDNGIPTVENKRMVSYINGVLTEPTTVSGSANDVTKEPVLTATTKGPVLFVNLVTREVSRKSANFRTLLWPAGNGLISAMCMESWGRSSFTRAMIELRADMKLIDTMMVIVLKLVGEGFSMFIIRVNPTTTPLAKMINNLERQMLDGKLVLVDDDEKPLKGFHGSGGGRGNHTQKDGGMYGTSQPANSQEERVVSDNEKGTAPTQELDYGIPMVENKKPLSYINIVPTELNIVSGSANDVTKEPVLTTTTKGPVSFAKLVTREPSRKAANFRTLLWPAGNGADVTVSLESVQAISEHFANFVYGVFVGKHIAYPVVNNYVKNICSKYGLVKSMMNSANGLFFSSLAIRMVKLHNVPIKMFNEDGLSAIATKLVTLLMFDSYTSAMCMKSYGSSSFAIAMIELRADMKLKDTIMVDVPKLVDEGISMCTIYVMYEWKAPRIRIGGILSWMTTGNSGVVSPTHENSSEAFASPSTTSLAKMINNLENQMLDEKLVLVDDDGKPLKMLIQIVKVK